MGHLLLVYAGTFTSVVGLLQLVFIIISLCQYACLVDVLRHFPTLVFIKILYFNKPTCYDYINVGAVIPEMGSQAFVLTNSVPRPTARVFTINGMYLPLILTWIVASATMVSACSRNRQPRVERCIWMSITSLITVVDIVVVVLFATDIYSTSTLTALVNFVGGTLNGAGNVDVNTSLAAIIMMIIYSRFGILLLLDVGLLCWILIDSGIRGGNTVPRSESSGNTFKSSNGAQHRHAGNTQGIIPRVSLLRRLPVWMIGRQPSSAIDESIEEQVMRRDTVPIKSPVTKNSVTFPDNLLSLPTRLACIVSQRQHQLQECVVDTSMRSPARGAQALPDSTLNPTDEVEVHETPTRHRDPMGRRGTAAELQGQLPWSYIPPSAHRMRDNLPEDEDLPPVPVPDYTVHPKYRKASVHRTGSNVSLMKNLTITNVASQTTAKKHPEAVHRTGSNVSPMKNLTITNVASQTTAKKHPEGLNPLNHMIPDVLY